MNVVLRGVRVIDPRTGVDVEPRDVWINAGRIMGIERRLQPDGAGVIDLTPRGQGPACVLCPGFIDLHAHLRAPGDRDAETIDSGARAAAAGGYTTVLAMANTRPPIDTPDRVRTAAESAAGAGIDVLHTAAVTRGLEGRDLVDVAGCAGAGAAAFSDDGRNRATATVLAEALRQSGAVSRPVLVHPEDEELIAQRNPGDDAITRCELRPAEAEARAVERALTALAMVGRGRLHLQHLSVAMSLDALRRARAEGATVTAEVTPHHLADFATVPPAAPESLRKTNPPLRSAADRMAMVEALREGLIDAVATDHAPHVAAEKTAVYADAAPGMIGLETALAVCITLGGMGGRWLPVLVERLTSGPHRVLGEAAGVAAPHLRVGEPATCVLFDPDARWTVSAAAIRSRSANTPFLGARLQGRVLLTLARGAVVHRDGERITAPRAETAHA